METLNNHKVKRILREQYESMIYKVLIETELKEKQIMDAAGLEVTRSRDSDRGKKGDKLTIHSVERRGGSVIVKLVSPDNIVAPITPKSSGMNLPTQEYTLEEFESNFEV